MEACLSKSMGHKETGCANWDRRAVWNWSFVLGYVEKWNSLFFPCWDFPCCHFPDWETQILNFHNMGYTWFFTTSFCDLRLRQLFLPPVHETIIKVSILSDSIPAQLSPSILIQSVESWRFDRYCIDRLGSCKDSEYGKSCIGKFNCIGPIYFLIN